MFRTHFIYVLTYAAMPITNTFLIFSLDVILFCYLYGVEPLNQTFDAVSSNHISDWILSLMKVFFWGFKKRSYFISLNNFLEIFKSSSLAFLSIIIIFLSPCFFNSDLTNLGIESELASWQVSDIKSMEYSGSCHQ